jgi:hypothetical protein
VQLPRNERNVLYALAAAGDYTSFGTSRVRVKPVQPDAPDVVYDLTDVDDLRRALVAPPLQAFDTLVVEAAETSAVYVIGLVNHPGPVRIPPQTTLTVLRTIAAAGGLLDFLKPQEATLTCRLANGEQKRVRLDLAAIQKGLVEDIPLKPGDILDVPHTAGTRFRQWFANNIRLGPFGVQSVYDPVQVYVAEILRNDNNNDNNVFRQSILGGAGAQIGNAIVPALTPKTPPQK